MYIREINITGFRSYRELTAITDFSPKHNVVVGRNGSGKSNFFYAIQFLLANDSNQLTQDQRNNLLHEGTGSRATTARVEIVFDNSDHRLPSESDVVKIARQVTSKKDSYSIDNKVATKTDILNLLESAGISRSNPYYIVKQGKVMELAVAPDSQRLKLIKEVAGTKVFDERKEESMKLLEETQNKLAKCTELLGHMEERLRKLEEEKEDLKEYQKFDKMKRAIEHTINNLECNETRRRCDKLAAQREKLNTEQNTVETRLMNVQNLILQEETQIRKLEQRYKGFREEADRLAAEQMDVMERLKSCELTIADLNTDVSQERSECENAEEEVDRLRSEITDKEAALERLEPQHRRLLDDENRLKSDIAISQQRCKELRAKLARNEQFASIEERDRFLQHEIRASNQQKRKTTDHIAEIESSIRADEAEEAQLKNDVTECEREIRNLSSDMSSKKQELEAKRKDIERESQAVRDRMLTEDKARNDLEALKREVQNAESQLAQLAPRSVVNGIRSVRESLAWMEANNGNGEYSDILQGYYSCVIEHIQTPQEYFCAVEVTAENRLFYHVVSDDRVAMKILEHINRYEMRGECNFFPLNRIVAKPRRDVNDEDAEPLLKYLEYDNRYDAVMRQLFADTVIVANLAAGTRVARNENFNCVTIEGDQVNRRGPMTGGYMDRKRSRLEASLNLRELQLKLPAAQAALDAAAQASSEVKQRFERLNIEATQLENDLTDLRQRHNAVNDKKHEIAAGINRRAVNAKPKTEHVKLLRERLRQYDARISDLQAQVGTPLNNALSEQERADMQQLEDETSTKATELEKITRERLEVEKSKSRLEHSLHTNLKRRKDHLELNIENQRADDKHFRLVSEQERQRQLTQQTSRIAHRTFEVNEHLADYNNEREEHTKNMEKYQTEKSQYDEEIESKAKQIDTICTKMAELEIKKEEFTRKMNEVGSVSGDVLHKYQNLNLKQLDKKLTECINELKKYENVNKKALDQFVRAKGHKEKLSSKVGELKQNETSITSLIEVLNNRRHETLQLTYKQVAKNFNEVFRKLIPDGNANLIMHQLDVNASQNSSEHTQNSSAAGDQPRDYIGVGVQVSFTGTGGTRELNHLSGGQKSLVALALIFAIQKCDPAPFYLFDEVDAALDRQHRQSVAAMIHELSENAQFITTTFRPELLEHAEKYYGVVFRNKVSYIDPTTREQAYEFVRDDQMHT